MTELPPGASDQALTQIAAHRSWTADPVAEAGVSRADPAPDKPHCNHEQRGVAEPVVQGIAAFVHEVGQKPDSE